MTVATVPLVCNDHTHDCARLLVQGNDGCPVGICGGNGFHTNAIRDDPEMSRVGGHARRLTSVMNSRGRTPRAGTMLPRYMTAVVDQGSMQCQ